MVLIVDILKHLQCRTVMRVASSRDRLAMAYAASQENRRLAAEVSDTKRMTFPIWIDSSDFPRAEVFSRFE